MSACNRVLGSFLGALVGAIWAFLRTWIASANSFNQVARGLVIVGILLGWIPGLIAALLGLFYGAYQGQRQDWIDGVLSVLMGIEIFIRNFEENSKKVNAQRNPLDYQKLAFIPIVHSSKHKRKTTRV